jgi:hypothetical protein
MKCEAIDPHRFLAHTFRLCLDSQVNLPRFIIPIGIHIWDPPSRIPRPIFFHFRHWGCRICLKELFPLEDWPDQNSKEFLFAYSIKIISRGPDGQGRINLSIDDKQSVRIIGTGDYGFDLLKILDLVGRNFLAIIASSIFCSASVRLGAAFVQAPKPRADPCAVALRKRACEAGR